MSDARMDTLMGRLLQAGVLLASATVLLGGVLLLRARAHTQAAYSTFHSEPAHLRSIGLLFRTLRHGDASTIIQLGILLLVATPVARVAFAAVAFLVQRDWIFVAVSLLVLTVLLLSLFRVI